MLPLAITSTPAWIRRLGGRAWQRLHRLAYVAAVAGVVHYWWLVKADISAPRRYAVVRGGAAGRARVARLAEPPGAWPGVGAAPPRRPDCATPRAPSPGHHDWATHGIIGDGIRARCRAGAADTQRT